MSGRPQPPEVEGMPSGIGVVAGAFGYGDRADHQDAQEGKIGHHSQTLMLWP
jgi:hypothetical protein